MTKDSAPMQRPSSRFPDGEIGVVIPCFNAESTVHQAVLSALGQSGFDGIVTVVNDGSTDNSLRVLENLKANYPNRVRILSTENKGACHARNLGVSRTETSYVAFLDADDFWHDGKLLTQRRFMEENAGAVATTTWYQAKILGKKRLSKIRKFNWTPDDMRAWAMMGSRAPALNSTLLIERRILLSLGGHDETLGSYAEDLDLGWRIWKNGGVFCVPQSLAALGVSPSQGHRNIDEMWRAMRIVLSRISASDPDIGQTSLHYAEGTFWLKKIVNYPTWSSTWSFFVWMLRNPGYVGTTLRHRFFGGR